MRNAKINVVLYANNTGADQPAHARSLINTFVIRAMERIMGLL